MKYTFSIKPEEGVLNTVAYMVSKQGNVPYLKKINSIVSYNILEFGINIEEEIPVDIVVIEFTKTNANVKTGMLDKLGIKFDEEEATVPIIYPDANIGEEVKKFKYTSNPSRNFCIINALSGEQVDTTNDKCELNLSNPYIALEVQL